MALADLVSRPRPSAVPSAVQTRLDRGRKAMLKDASKRRLCMKFEKGDTYWYVDTKGLLNFQPTVTQAGGGKPAHRIRNTYNFIRPLVEDKVSASTQRVPSYEITPSTTDPEDLGAARLAERVALYGYDQWHVRRATIKTVTSAIAHGGDGFAMPYFEPNIGPYTEVDGEWVGQGDIRIVTFGGNEVYWEAGCDYYESRWFATERARSIDDVREMPGYLGGKLTADANTSDIPNDRSGADDMVMVTEYYERPCPEYHDGRRIIIANGRVICPEEPYPLRGIDGKALDEPLIHRLTYTIDPDTDRDLGLVWQLIDAQRTVQDCWNKLLEWKNRCLNPQMIAAVNSLLDRPDDVPGAIRYYRQGFDKPTWENPPAVPQALFQMLDAMKSDMRYMASYQDIQAGADVAAKTVNAVIEQSQARWQSFLGDLAEWHSRLMRHCLLLVARYYTEPRLLVIKGRFGPELVQDFRGAQLNGQINVRVNPGSLEARTKQQVTNQVLAFADRGWVTPQAAMAAINGGTAEKLIESYELDVSKANRIIQKVRDGSVMDMPTRHETDPATGGPLMDPQTGLPAEVPGWMPEDGIDNLEVWQAIISDWAKTQDYESLDPGRQEVVKLILKSIRDLQARQAQRQMQQQAAQAEQLGMNNAAKPQQPKPLPDMPSGGSEVPANA